MDGLQPRQMGMTGTREFKEGAYWAHRERKEFKGSDQKCFDHHAFYFGYNVTNVISIAIKMAEEAWGAFPQRNYSQQHSLQYLRMALCKHHLISIGKLQSINNEIPDCHDGCGGQRLAK